ncbi:MOSC N-terminal beta barrel domain containing protein [Tritrichomonas foetus]|uniref:MOSC N-terminal beta barrel domain containing protein n=1 Tax=Tritrichomonas foetus TaxID=1144522 RepID=A0A1J4KH95_9EUKA|nr:MOSC N-terminal beta barrel domain containing protein [Tritrichomonas foetus]|eukprot:OHT09204.1 MOSC N-terminal beta barrel domain containing protein [Tritrichomonas foetus]
MEEFRKNQFPQLDDKLYFDFAGAMPICKAQVDRYNFLMKDCIQNPHSASQISRTSNETARLRNELLKHFNTSPDEYIVAFSHNTTTGAQTIASLLNLDNISSFHYLFDNHNSIIGLATLLKGRKPEIEIKCIKNIENDSINSNALFAFPMNSNFNGKKYPLEWIELIQNHGSFVLFDAASTCSPDLSKFKPDFVVLSLLKLFGAHGGAILIRRDRIHLFNDPCPAGGNLLYLCSRNDKFRMMPSLSKKLEGGTLAYTDLMLALTGLKTRREFGNESFIQNHLKNLSKIFYEKMGSLKHSNGKNIVVFYRNSHENEMNDYPIFSFNLLKNDGSIINHHEILFSLATNNVDIRAGSHCNPGATFTNLNWKEEEVVAFGEDSNQNNKCVSSLCLIGDRPVATLRVSFGYPSLEKDIEKFVDIIKRFFVDGGPNKDILNKELVLPMTLKRILVSPIIGCRGYEVTESHFDRYGLEFDRRWKLVDDDGNLISTPQCFGVASLVAKILDGKDLLLDYNNGQATITVPIANFTENKNAPANVKKYGTVYSSEVSMFLNETIGRYAYLVKLSQNQLGKFPFSGVTEESCNSLFPQFDVERWHANFVFSGAPAFSEEGRRLKNMSLGNWNISLWRWRVVCMTSSVIPGFEEVGREEVRKLAETRSFYGMTPFGMLFGLNCDETPFEKCVLKVGDTLKGELA